MLKRQQVRVQTRKGTRTSIGLALVVALALHALFLFLPFSGQTPVTESSPALIELQLTTLSPQPPEPEVPQAETEPPEPIIEPEESIVQLPSESPQTAPPPDLATQVAKQEVESPDEQDRLPLTSVILSRQFITQESAADKIFGKPLRPQQGVLQEGFHFPARQDMIALLDQPMPDLPFAYTPGLVHFAYDPGVKGDLQRFWDVITPEFGWRTNNGTEFRCVWVLVIVGCGWK